MPIDELLHAFEHDTDAEIRAIVAQAERDAAELEAAAERQRHATVADAAGTYEAACRHDADLRIATAAREARLAVLRAQAEMLGRVRAALVAALPARLAGDEALALALVESAVECAGPGRGVLHCPPALESVACLHAPAQLAVSSDGPNASGVVIELASGARIDATLETLLAREWPRLACAALEQVT
jgi:vacuolar-type H+-ATPase subunit E/Vma4